MNKIQEQITSVWEVEQEILDVVHQICTEHGLRYSLAYGTLLGAVRHGGFIPWDVDIDIDLIRTGGGIAVVVVTAAATVHQGLQLCVLCVVIPAEQGKNCSLNRGIYAIPIRIDLFGGIGLVVGVANVTLQCAAISMINQFVS